MNPLSKEEAGRLLVLLEEHVRHAELSQREMERRLGVSQGYLGALFRGRIQLTVAHVYGIASVLGKDPLYFFMAASPPPNPDWLLKQLGISKDTRPSFPEDRPPVSRSAVLEVVRTTIRGEMDKLLERNDDPDDQG